jgi:hypothetical protein
LDYSDALLDRLDIPDAVYARHHTIVWNLGFWKFCWQIPALNLSMVFRS